MTTSFPAPLYRENPETPCLEAPRCGTQPYVLNPLSLNKHQESPVGVIPSLVTAITFSYRMNFTHLQFSSVSQLLTGRRALSEPHPGLRALPLAPSLSLCFSR